MPRKGEKRAKPPVGDGRDPDGLYQHLLRFNAWQAEKNYAARTIEGREANLRAFLAWAAERGLSRPQEITRPILERYQRHLFLYRQKNGQPLSARSQHARMTPVRAFFKWLARRNHILHNPASELELPRHILTVAEVEAVLAVPDLGTGLGLRDRAILEVLYSTGMRRM
ncbi:phage integrase family protein with SAM-like domain, partial [Nitrospirillum amazonense]